MKLWRTLTSENKWYYSILGLVAKENNDIKSKKKGLQIYWTVIFLVDLWNGNFTEHVWCENSG